MTEADQKGDPRPTAPVLLEKVALEGGWRLHLQVPEDLFYFQGHFKSTPVVAGVCQLKWVVDAIAFYWGHRLQLSGMQAVKFHQLLLPGQKFDIEIKTHDQRKWSYLISSESGKVASGRLIDQPSARGIDGR